MLRPDTTLCVASCGVFVWTMYWWKEPRETLWNVMRFALRRSTTATHSATTTTAGSSSSHAGGGSTATKNEAQPIKLQCAPYERDHPANIRKRVVSIVCACLYGAYAVGVARRFVAATSSTNAPAEISVSSLLHEAVASTTAMNAMAATLKDGLMFSTFGLTVTAAEGGDGLVRELLVATTKSMAITGALFLGVVADHLYDFYEEWWCARARSRRPLFWDTSLPPQQNSKFLLVRLFKKIFVPHNDQDLMIRLRNYVICPIGEELFFRALMFYLLVDVGGRSNTIATWISSFVFSLAHFHHFVRYFEVELAYASKRVDVSTKASALKQAFLGSLPQTIGDATVTAAFGLLSGLLFVKTNRNAFATAVAHSFCNYVGPPDPSFLKSRDGKRKVFLCVSYLVGISSFVALSFVL